MAGGIVHAVSRRCVTVFLSRRWDRDVSPRYFFPRPGFLIGPAPAPKAYRGSNVYEDGKCIE